MTDFQKLIIFSELPSVNHYKGFSRSGRVYKQKKTLLFEKKFKDSLPPNPKKLTGKVKVHFKCTFGSKRKRDLDNALKVPQDCLSGIFFDDDEQIHFLSAEKCYEKNNEHIEITISPYGQNEATRTQEAYTAQSEEFGGQKSDRSE